MKVVSERLGHANIAFTMHVYQHVLPGMQAAAADTFSLLLRNERNKAKPDSISDDSDEDLDGADLESVDIEEDDR